MVHHHWGKTREAVEMDSKPRGRTPLTNLRLEVPIRDAVDAHAEARGLGRSAVIREAVTEYLDRRGIEVATP